MTIELKTFQKNLTYNITAPIANILLDLNQIGEFDKLAEIKQKQYGKQALYSFLGILASFGLIVIFFTFFLEIPFFFNTVSFICIGIFGLTIFAIYVLTMRGKFQRLNISNHRYKVTSQVLQMLARDMDSNSNVELNLSFKAVNQKQNLKVSIAHPHKQKWKIDSYQHQWLQIKGQFLDKTRFNLTATELSKTQHGWKRSRSGKSKYKSKTRGLGLHVILTLTYPQRRYGAIKLLKDEVSHAVKLPKLSHLRGLKVTDKGINIGVRIASQIADNQEEVYQTITMMFLSCYQVLNLAKMLSK